MLNKKTMLLFSLSLVFVSPVWAKPQKGFTEMNVTGQPKVDMLYNVDDTKRITDYSGAKWFEACENDFTPNGNKCIEAFKDSSTNGEQKIMDINGTQTNPRNTGMLSVKNFGISSEEGVHEICIRNRDNADHTPGKGNLSDIVCKQVFYDKSGPIANKIVLNKGNHYINTGNIPVTMELYDNRAGIGKITYIADDRGTVKTIDFNKPGNNISCTRNDHPALGDGSYKCTISAILETDVNRDRGDMGFVIYDKVSNKTHITECKGSYVNPDGTGSCVMIYDKNKPTVNTDTKHGDNGAGLNNTTAHIEYHIKDEPAPPWITPSGIEQVIVENPDGSNKQWIVDERNNPDPSKTVDGILKDYILNHCPANLKFTVIDKAGNITVKTTDPIDCVVLKTTNFRVIDVVNPKLYTMEHPFQIQEWVGGDNPMIVDPDDGGWLGPGTPGVGKPYADLPSALAGANMTWDLTYEWTGDPNYIISGYYEVEVYNEAENYSTTISDVIEHNDFVRLDGTHRRVQKTFTVPSDAPGSDPARNSYTYVTIKVTLTIRTEEGGIPKYQTMVFPSQTTYGHIGEVVGSIDDYLWFGELS